MRAHWLQHVPFEGLGSIEGWLQARGWSIGCTPLHTQATLPALDGIDLLIAMGGPMSVNDGQVYPWLAAEKVLLRAAIDAGVRVLGICLGAQLIASALGARVHAAPQPEIGWWPVQGRPTEGADGFRFPQQLEVFQWHGETFELPPGATGLAASPLCPQQAFSLGPRVLGLQFHLETTPASARSLIAHCGDALQPGGCVQSAAQMLDAAPARYARLNAEMGRVLEYLTAA